ncbi:MAG: hypothetical protein ACR2NA_10445 [Solirubrobacterales bacterium]
MTDPATESRWTEAWASRYPHTPAAHPARRRPGTATRGRHVIVAAALLALTISSVAGAQGGEAESAAIDRGDALRAEVRNGTTGKETEIIGDFNASSGSKGGYVTRQSNTQTGAKAGGAVIYGCRGASGGTAGGSAPCIRANNLASGYAFEFNSRGTVGGLISVGDGGDEEKPFITNATGVATGLNADRIDGKGAGDLVMWARVSSNGTLERGSGATAAERKNTGDYEIQFSRDVSQCSYQGTSTQTGNDRIVAANATSGNAQRVSASVTDPDVGGSSDVNAPFQVAVHC